MASPALPEHRAKRTHARRSCDVCKIRKTRCELPDLDVPSSHEPLPLDKACHRCKILSLPCVVDDSARKQRKRITIAEYGGQPPGGPSQQSQAPKPKRARTSMGGSKASGSAPVESHVGEIPMVDHTLDIFRGLDPGDMAGWSLVDALGDGNGPGEQGAGANAGLGALGGPMPPFGSGEPVDSWQSKSMKLHGRPLELVCAMLGVAYGKRGLKRLGGEEGFEVDLEGLVDAETRVRLEPGVARLRTYHPFLDTLPGLFSSHAADPQPATALLLSLVLYLSTLALPNSDSLSHIRSTLTPYIISLRETILLSLPQSFVAIQALNILCLHAPLGVLPAQMANPRSLAVARGQISAATQIGVALKFTMMIRRFTQVSRMSGPGHMRWEVSDSSLFLSTCVAEAVVALEEETVNRPTSLADAQDVIEDFWGVDNYVEVWSMMLHAITPAEIIGRLSLCDRFARLSEVIESCLRIRTALDTAAGDSSFDIVRALGDELKYVTERLDAIDTKHDAILALLTPTSNGVEAGWLAYRSLRRRYEANKVYVHGLRAFMATAYLPGHPLAFSGLPTDMTQPFQKVSYALSRATNPPDIIPFIMAPNNPATQATWTWGKHRGEICESTLAAFAEIGRGLNEGSQRIILPLHDAMCIAVESAKILMEMQAGSIMMHRRSKDLSSPFRIPGWVYSLHRTCEVMRGIGGLSVRDGKAGGSTESVANGCANLVGSMIRLTNDWTRESQKEDLDAESRERVSEEERKDLAAMGLEAHPQHHMIALHGNGPEGDDAPPSAGVTGDGFGDVGEMGEMGEMGHRAHYMEGSDRWMASDHPAPVGETPEGGSGYVAPSHAGSGNVGGSGGDAGGGSAGGPAPTALDLLLSHMFNYSYQPPTISGQAQGQGQQQQHQQPLAGVSHMMGQRQQQQQSQQQHLPHQQQHQPLQQQQHDSPHQQHQHHPLPPPHPPPLAHHPSVHHSHSHSHPHQHAHSQHGQHGQHAMESHGDVGWPAQGSSSAAGVMSQPY